MLVFIYHQNPAVTGLFAKQYTLLFANFIHLYVRKSLLVLGLLLPFAALFAQHVSIHHSILPNSKASAGQYIQQKTAGMLGLSPMLATPQSQLYQITYRNVPIMGCQLSVVQGAEYTCIVAGLPAFDSFVSCSVPPDVWWPDTARKCFVPARVRKHLWYNVYTIENEKTVHTVDERRFLAIDTVVKAKVFAPDPVTTTATEYGKPLRDYQDSSYPDINAGMTEVWVACTYSADSFRLQTPLLAFANISDPKQESGVHKTLDFTRNQPGFEELNVFYHLQQLGQWWTALGFARYADTVQVDAHAFSGLDESVFNPLNNPPSIEFGTGGVDDAEDADAIVHEYTHAAFHAIVPGAYAGSQRQAVEEGVCDFMAVAYSNKYSTHQSAWVYNWDGHNEFWDGRNLINSKKFPASVTNFPHQDGEIFGAALYSLAQEIGYDTTVKLVFSALPLFISNISMPAAAELMLKTDSVLFGGKYRWPLIKALHQKGLLPLLQQTQAVAAEPMRLYNSAAFAVGLGNLVVRTATPQALQVLDACGKVVYESNEKAEETVLVCSDFKAGLYVLKMGTYSVKIVKF